MSNIDYILYDGNCYDGFGAAMVAWFALSKTNHHVVPMPVNYGKPPPSLQPGNNVYILGFSYPAKVLLEMALPQAKVVVLDHHATAEKDLSLEAFMKHFSIDETMLRVDREATKDGFMHVQNITIKFDMAKSGAMLAWDFFRPDEKPPKLIQYLQDRDLWKFEMVNSRAVSAWLQTKPMEFASWQWIMEKMEYDRQFLEEIFVAGNACLRLKEQQVDQMADNFRMMAFDLSCDPPKIVLDPARWSSATLWIAIANASVFFSEVGERLLELHLDTPFAAYYFDRADGKRQWGLHSRKDFDCSAIAKAFGGGGHKQAAGFTQDSPW
jgi:oligoribonuclease NrnB/cAMP/cGMP phosphodiesterase (DHH superfamily)